jgi:hypothetical protein
MFEMSVVCIYLVIVFFFPVRLIHLGCDIVSLYVYHIAIVESVFNSRPTCTE